MASARTCVASMDPRPYIRILIDAFTARFLLFVSIVYFAVKGFAFKAIMNVELPYFKNHLHISGDEYQKFYNITMMSFAIKPLVGAISDNLPLCGRNKRYYVVVYCLLGAAGVGAATQLNGEPSNGPIAAVLLFFAMIGVAATDLLCEGKYSEIMGQRPETGSRLVSWIWGCFTIGSIIAAGVGGPLADLGDTTKILWITFPFFLLPVLPALMGWIPERPTRLHLCEASDSDDNERNRPTSQQQHPSAAGESTSLLVVAAAVAVPCKKVSNTPTAEGSVPPVSMRGADDGPVTAVALISKNRIVALSVATSIAAIGTIVVSLYGGNIAMMAYIGPVSVVLFLISFFVLPPAAAKANLYMFLKELLYLQINGPVDYFYTADAQCVPGGPAFDYTFYQTYANLTTNAACIVAVVLFQRFLSGTRFRTVFWITTVLKVTVSMVDIVLVKRWNQSLGIDDKIVYMFGDAFVYQAATMIDFMPASVLISRLCPPGLESTMFAFLAGFSNFGQNLGRSIGIVISEYLDIKTVAPCNFENLYLLICIGHMLLPLLLLPLAAVLISNEPMQEEADSSRAAPEAVGMTTVADDVGEMKAAGTAVVIENRSRVSTAHGTTRATWRSSRRRSTRFSSYGGDGGEYEVFYDLDDDEVEDSTPADGFALRRRRSTAAYALRASLSLKQI